MGYKPKAGEAFICENESYADARLYLTYEKDGVLIAYYYRTPEYPEDERYIKLPVDELDGPFFPSFSSFLLRGKRPSGLGDELSSYIAVEECLKKLLIDSKSNRIEIKKAESKILEETNEKEERISAILKILISEKLLYRYASTKTSEFIEFTELKTKSENSKQYYGSLAQEIAVKSKQISLLTSHGQTAGNYREYILRSLLEKYLPSRFGVGTGFIEDVSRQLDIIIYDKVNFPVVFKEGDLIVVHKEAVRGIIEVKTTLDSAKLKDSLQLFYDIFRAGLFKPSLPIFKGVYAFNSNFENSKKVAESINRFYRKPYFEKAVQSKMTREVQYLYHEVTAVCALNEHFLFTKYAYHGGKEGKNIVPSLYSITYENGLDVQTAAFIASLFDYLDGDFYSKRTAQKGFNDLMSTDSVEVKFESHIGDKDWIPRSASPGEHDFGQESIIHRLDQLGLWFKGELSSSEYIRNIEQTESNKALQPTPFRYAQQGG